MKYVKLILSGLWVGRMLSSLQGDSTRMHDPVMLAQMVEGTTDVVITNELLLVMSMLMAVPMFMSVLSLMLKDKACRVANLGIGIFFVCFDLMFLIIFFQSAVYEVFWAIVYLVFVSLVVLYAWKWPEQERQP